VRKKELRLGFIGEYRVVEEREREGRRTAGAQIDDVADVPLGLAWRPLGTGGLDVAGRWRASNGGEGGGRANQGTRGAKESGAGLQGARESGRRRWRAAHGHEQRKPGLEEEDDDRSAISKNCRDSTVKSR
jgi:hypothetical protein